VFYPGENKKNIKDTNMKTGVVVDPKILEELHKTAKDVGLNIKI
jgi:LDH2 family malate/lactate/ureidoglycolate dehydrogenase